MIDPEKYIVADRDGNIVPDAVVIRLQDVFAPAVLHMYVLQIDLALKLAPEMEKAQKRQLIELSEYFALLAIQADEHQSGKLPTL